MKSESGYWFNPSHSKLEVNLSAGQTKHQPLNVKDVSELDCGVENVKLRYTIMAQLHEQYAINNNAGMQSVVSLLVGMFAVLGGFGYVWLHVGSRCSEKAENCFNGEQLLFVLAASLIVLLIMTYICMFQGTRQRCDQFIVQKIREKAFNCKYEAVTGKISKCDDAPKKNGMAIEYDDVFYEGYHPYNKCGLSIIQGLYGEFAKIFAFVGAVLCSVSYYKLIGVALYEKLAIYTVFCLIAYALLWILFLVRMIYKYKKSDGFVKSLSCFDKLQCLLNHLFKALLVWELVIFFSLHLCIWMTDVYSTKVGYDTRETCVAPELEKPPVEPCDRKNL